ncbi:TA system antitoxin ParD family protein [Rhodobacter capsulatus]|uniref:TA system antitoxin ParD family protein n=1 Tax=Rhodobacter capsulatus TaxID=1061 RepID=UPI0040264648
MAQSVKLADDVMAAVRREADLHSRSVAGQITHWLRLGKAIEQSGAYDHARVTAALDGRLDPVELREEEAIAWLDAFTEKMATPASTEQAFFAERRQLGRGVGLDAAGNLVHAGPDAAR